MLSSVAVGRKLGGEKSFSKMKLHPVLSPGF